MTQLYIDQLGRVVTFADTEHNKCTGCLYRTSVACESYAESPVVAGGRRLSCLPDTIFVEVQADD